MPPAPAGVCHSPQLTATRAANSACPQQTWWDRARLVLPPDKPVTFVNVGANKGFNLALMAQSFGANVSGHAWAMALLEYMAEQGQPYDAARQERLKKGRGAIWCGVCRACAEAPLVKAGDLRAYGIELVPSTARWLRSAVRRFGLDASTHIFNNAAGNESGSMVHVAPRPVGSESATGKTQGGSAGESLVETLSLDDFLRAQHVPHATLVSIDTEGLDALVIHGLRRHLQLGRVGAIEFEYIGGWRERGGGMTLGGTLSLLDSFGYSCWWEAEDGCVSPAGCHLDRVLSTPYMSVDP